MRIVPVHPGWYLNGEGSYKELSARHNLPR
jgi:hypothetical protein